MRLNGRVFEAVVALGERRPRYDLYHSALTVRLEEGAYAVEMGPERRDAGAANGMVAGGAVGSRLLRRLEDLPVRDPLRAGRRHPGPRRGRGRPAPADRRRRGRAAAARPGGPCADAGMGARPARDRGDVELELADLMGDHPAGCRWRRCARPRAGGLRGGMRVS